MFRSRSRGFYLYMFLRREREREKERELDNLAIRYIHSFIEYCFSSEVYKKRQAQFLSFSLPFPLSSRYDSNLLGWMLDGCIRTRKLYNIPLLKSKVWRMKTESKVHSLYKSRRERRVKFAWRPTWRYDPRPYVRRSSCFSFFRTVLRSIT